MIGKGKRYMSCVMDRQTHLEDSQMSGDSKLLLFFILSTHSKTETLPSFL